MKNFFERKTTKILAILLALLCVLFSFAGCKGIVDNAVSSLREEVGRQMSEFSSNFSSNEENENSQNVEIIDSIDRAENELTVAFLDVGQADSTLLIMPNGESMLVDTGDKSSYDKINRALSLYSIDKIDTLVLTHPHVDHIGSATNIIKNYEIGSVYMPQVSATFTPTTATYKKTLEALIDKNLKAIFPKVSDIIYDKDGVKVQVLAPLPSVTENFEDVKDDSRAYSNALNNYSIVLLVTYNNTKFLLMGDAGQITEQAILSNFDSTLLDCDVIKLGHHGSYTSSSKAFLQAVSPNCAVISCGANNDYGHPHKEVIDLLKTSNINYFVTATSGTVIANSDGESIKISNNI